MEVPYALKLALIVLVCLGAAAGLYFATGSPVLAAVVAALMMAVVVIAHTHSETFIREYLKMKHGPKIVEAYEHYKTIDPLLTYRHIWNSGREGVKAYIDLHPESAAGR